jgi:hypothetical protein
MEEWDFNWDVLDPSEKILIQDRISTMFSELRISMNDQWMGAARLLGYDENFIYFMQKEREYKHKCAEWDSYQEWKRSRNPARSILEEKFGYDTKHGMHLVRLIRMCREILTEGKVIVKRPDHEELLAIRNGSMSYEELIEWANNQETELATFYKTNNSLPKNARDEQIDALCENSIRAFLQI